MSIDEIVQKIGLCIFVFAVIVGIIFAFQMAGQLGKTLADIFTLMH